MQNENLLSICPLLLPQDKNGLRYDGFIEINFPVSMGGEHFWDQSFRLSIAQPNEGSLKDASISCSWRLWNILHSYQDVIKQRLNQSENLASFLVEFKNLVEKLVKCKQDDIKQQSLPLNTYAMLTSELEHIGWDKLSYINDSFNVIKLKTRDSENREHIVTVHIPPEYPDVVPKCSADVPEPFHFKGLKISEGRLLECIYDEFCQIISSYEIFWNVMDRIDQNCWILEPEHPTRADASRRIALGS